MTQKSLPLDIAPESTGGESVVNVGEIFRTMPLTSRHWLAGMALYIAFVIEGWEMMVLILAGGLISADLKLSTTQLGSLLSSIYVGMVPGCLIWGKIADIMGRKKTLVVSLVLYGIVSGISALSHSYAALWWSRMAAGIAISGVLVSPFVHLEELLPLKQRGRGAVMLAAGWPVGLLLAIGLVHVLRNTGWHAILAVSSLAGLWAFVIQKFVPESPYWAASRGDQGLARRSLEFLYGSRFPPELRTVRFEVNNFEQGRFRRLFEPVFLASTLQQLFINAGLSFSNWALTAWLPLLLLNRGLSPSQGDRFLVFTALIMFPGYITASWATGRFGRKHVMWVFIAGATASSFGFALSATLTQMYIFSGYLFFFNQGAWGVWDTWMGEIYPTSIRGVGYSLGLTMQRIANSLAPVIVGLLLARHTSFAAVVTFISCAFLATLIVSGFVRETEHVVLD